MAQSEDNELRDLVIEALEKNGSLAKIRALLRANIFLAFEDCENIKQNANLDEILRVPEGLISLSIVHEFLEYCNLKNTLFVYVSESRQGKQYSYEGEKSLTEKLKFCKKESANEPTLVSLVRRMMKSNMEEDRSEREEGLIYKDDQNCTYIMHDSSGSTSNSQSDSSSDEKNKPQLRLQLDHSDTDTSSDSMRERLSSEYIPNEHIANLPINEHKENSAPSNPAQAQNYITSNKVNNESIYQNFSLKMSQNSSSDSTSYVEIKPPDIINGKSTIPECNHNEINTAQSNDKTDSGKSNTSSLISSISNKSKKLEGHNFKQSSDIQYKESNQDVDYSLDFTSSKDTVQKEVKSPASVQEDLMCHQEKQTSLDSPHQTSQSSQSSISISDVADLISDYSPRGVHEMNVDNVHKSSESKKSSQLKSPNFESGDFSESTVPSLSNLSLEIHSD